MKAIALTRRDQFFITSLVLAGLISVFLVRAGHWSQLVDLDDTPITPAHFTVDVNEAGWPDLVILPRIGPTLAMRIIASREQRGRYESPEELMRVRGIGPAILERVSPHLRFSKASASAGPAADN